MDLSRAGLIAAAGVDPWRLAEQVLCGDPAALRSGALRVRRAGLLAAEAADAGGRADRGVGKAYRNDGLAVFDVVASTGRGAALLAERGENIEEVARALLDVADALAEAAASTRSRLSTFEADLNRLIGRLHGVRITGPDPAAVTAAVAEAERCSRMAIDLVRGVGVRVQADVDAYGAVLVNRTARLAGLGRGAPMVGPDPGTATSFEMSPEDRFGSALGEELAENPDAAGKVVAGLAGIGVGLVLLLRGRPALPLIDRSGRLLGNGVVEIGYGVTERLARPQVATAPEARNRAVRKSVLHPDGSLPGEPGRSRRVRVVEQPEMDRIEQSIRDRLGPPDHVVRRADKGQVEIWKIGPDETVVIRDFSTSGSRGTVGDRTMDIDVQGLEGVEKIHVKP